MKDKHIQFTKRNNYIAVLSRDLLYVAFLVANENLGEPFGGG